MCGGGGGGRNRGAPGGGGIPGGGGGIGGLAYVSDTALDASSMMHAVSRRENVFKPEIPFGAVKSLP
ncbi:hypothetical protein GCM10027285_21180 [Oleiagrimonas citrea]